MNRRTRLDTADTDSGSPPVRPEPDADPLVGVILRDTYHIIAKLGEGAMGRVYLAENTNVQTIRYAVKMLKHRFTTNPRFRSEFFNEAKRQADLTHPNIVQVHDYFTISNDYFLVLMFVDGQVLSDKIDEAQGAIDEKDALSYMKDILKALHCAHERGIIHQDVKASNIMIDKDCARLTDFGIAREAVDECTSKNHGWVGTPEYMSPEQYVAPANIDQRADVYSAGIVLFEMLTGTLPFHGTSAEEILRQHVNSAVPDPRSLNRRIPKPLATIILKAVTKAPANRYQGSLEFLKAIEAYERGHIIKKWLVIAMPLSAGAAAVAVALLTPSIHVLPKVPVLTARAVDSFRYVCQATAKLPLLTRGLRIARQAEIHDNEEILRKKIKDADDNITKYAGIYANSIEKLIRYDKAAVQQALGLTRDSPHAVDIKYSDFIARDYERRRAKAQSPNRETMLQDCSSLLN